jgi:hypothetical protein
MAAFEVRIMMGLTFNDRLIQEGIMLLFFSATSALCLAFEERVLHLK